jgi:hypothetical protein
MEPQMAMAVDFRGEPLTLGRAVAGIHRSAQVLGGHYPAKALLSRQQASEFAKDWARHGIPMRSAAGVWGVPNAAEIEEQILSGGCHLYDVELEVV